MSHSNTTTTGYSSSYSIYISAFTECDVITVYQVRVESSMWSWINIVAGFIRIYHFHGEWSFQDSCMQGPHECHTYQRKYSTDSNQ